jgi:dihydrolipoamide dehydrogenase
LSDRLIINDDVFNWDDLPQSVAIFGPGVIGLELGQALHRLGVQTKVFSVGGAVGPLTDSAVRDYAAKALSEEFYLDPDVKVDIMQRQGVYPLSGSARPNARHDGGLRTGCYRSSPEC